MLWTWLCRAWCWQASPSSWLLAMMTLMLALRALPGETSRLGLLPALSTTSDCVHLILTELGCLMLADLDRLMLVN